MVDTGAEVCDQTEVVAGLGQDTLVDAVGQVGTRMSALLTAATSSSRVME